MSLGRNRTDVYQADVADGGAASGGAVRCYGVNYFGSLARRRFWYQVSCHDVEGGRLRRMVSQRSAGDTILVSMAWFLT